jgi:RNA polymerase sigma-70 factor (ECF subfamily)
MSGAADVTSVGPLTSDWFSPDAFPKQWKACYLFARRIVRDDDLARDVVQEAMLAAWLARHRYDPGRGTARSWLLSMVHNKAVDRVRSEELHRRRMARLAHAEPACEADPADAVVRRLGARESVRQALADLPPTQREVLVLAYFDGLTQTEIAKLTGLPLGTVKTRTSTGLRRLHTALSRDEPTRGTEPTSPLTEQLGPTRPRPALVGECV